MPETEIEIVMSSGGGAPRIPPRQVGKPGVREVADMCTGPEYGYLKGMKDAAIIAQGHNPKPSKAKVAAAMREVFSNPPSTLGKNQTKQERRQQLVAIGMSKARKGEDVREIEQKYADLCNWFIYNNARGKQVIDSAKRYEFVCAALSCVIEMQGMLLHELQRVNNRTATGYIRMPGGRSIPAEVHRE